MLETKSVEIKGRTYSVGQLPADRAFEIGCIVAEWRGKIVERMGDAALIATEARIDSVAAGGRALVTIAQMLRDTEYREKVWKPVLSVCMCDGVPVLRDDWVATYAGDRLAELYELHQASIDHSCGGFLRGLGLGAAPSPQL